MIATPSSAKKGMYRRLVLRQSQVVLTIAPHDLSITPGKREGNEVPQMHTSLPLVLSTPW